MKVAIKGFEGLYEIDDQGNVYSLRSNQIVKPFVNTGGYLKIGLYDKNRKRKGFYIHRLVAGAFIPNPDNLPCVNHKDGNKTNNSAENLEWCTQKENIQHAWKHGLEKGIGENHGCAKLTQLQVDSIRKEYVFNSKEHGTRALARKYGVNPCTIWAIVNYKLWKEVM